MTGDEGTLFLADFEALKSATADSPATLEGLWREREDLAALCDRLAGYRRSFDIAEEWTPVAFTAHVPTAASRARRDYDERWRQPVARIANRTFAALFDSMFPDFVADDDDPPGDPLDVEIENWKHLGKREASSIVHAFSCMADQRANDEFGDFEWVDDAQESWDRLRKIVGLDLKSAFWRRRAIPHILFPTHVSNRYGRKGISIYRRLHDAARAFIFGAPLAALAMQRAVLEELLKEHWGAERGIQDANLPSLSHDARAHRLKRQANAALHGVPEDLTSDQMDREIVKNFLLLRELIEATPGG